MGLILNLGPILNLKLIIFVVKLTIIDIKSVYYAKKPKISTLTHSNNSSNVLIFAMIRLSLKKIFELWTF